MAARKGILYFLSFNFKINDSKLSFYNILNFFLYQSKIETKQSINLNSKYWSLKLLFS